MKKIDLMLNAITHGVISNIQSMLDDGFNPKIYRSKPLQHTISLCKEHVHLYDVYTKDKRTVDHLINIGIILVNYGADINRTCKDNCDTLLSLCAYVKRNDVIRYFINNDFDLNWDKNVYPALEDAAYLDNNTEIVNELINYAHSKTDLTKTSLLLSMANKNQPEACQKLLDLGLPINIQDEYGKTPLMLAAENHHAETVALLLKNNADYTIKTKHDVTALELCVSGGLCEEIIKTFIENDRLISTINTDDQESVFKF